jgi:hypothetical protein
MSPDARPPEERPSKWSSADRYLIKLWAIVSLLWTVATLFRVCRIWIPIDGLRGVLSGPWLWLELTLPPIMFGCIMLGIRQLGGNQGNCRSILPWCRRKT